MGHRQSSLANDGAGPTRVDAGLPPAIHQPATANGTTHHHTTRRTASAESGTGQQGRLVVDVRGSYLDNDYSVWIKREPPPRAQELEAGVQSAWALVQGVGGLIITVLTIQKLWEDIRFMRLLRRELSGLASGFLDGAAGGGGAGGSLGTSQDMRTHRADAAPPLPPPPPEPPLDLDLGLGPGSGATGQQDKGPAGRGADNKAEGAEGKGAGGAAADGADAEATGGPKETTWASISGLTEVKMLLQEATVLPTLRPDLFVGIRQPPKALLLFGPPGTGKTMLARAVAAESRATFLPITGSSVLSKWYGQSEQNVKALFDRAAAQQPAVIFIDEVDSLLGRRSSGGLRDSMPDKRVTNEFLAFIDGIQTAAAAATAGAARGGGGGGGGGGVGAGPSYGGSARIVVIAATNCPWDLDEAALSRFSRRIYVPLPDKATRAALLRKALAGVACSISEAEWGELADRCDKYSGRDLVAVCREASMRPLRELWGERLLETAGGAAGGGAAAGGAASGTGGAAPAPHAGTLARLVALVADSLQAAGQGATGCGGKGKPRQASGRSKKRIRQELERWKRRHGAHWCDVGAVMRQAEEVVAARCAADSGNGRTGADSGNGGLQPAAVGNSSSCSGDGEGRQRVEHQANGAGGSVASGQQGDVDGAQAEVDSARAPFGAAAAAAGGPAATCPAAAGEGGGQGAEGAGVAAAAVTALGNGDAAGEDGSEGSSSPTEGLDPGQTNAVGKPAVESGGGEAAGQPCKRAGCNGEAAGNGQGVGHENGLASSSGDSAVPAEERAERVMSCNGTGNGGTAGNGIEKRAPESQAVLGVGDTASPTMLTSDDAGTDATAAGATTLAIEATATATAATTSSTDSPADASPSTSCGTSDSNTANANRETSTTTDTTNTTAPSASGSSARRGSGSGDSTGGSGGGGGSNWTVSELLALPASAVRPVTRADVEAALALIAHTEFDMSARYTEWDEQFGSGAVRSGGRLSGRAWMSMYA